MKSEGDGERLSRDLISVWHSFVHEVHKATVSLMYLLQGMELVRNRQPSSYQPSNQQSVTYPPSLSYIDLLLCPVGDSSYSYLNDLLKREGEAEQLAFKGWIEQVYFLWETRFRNELRNELKKGLEGSGVIRPETDPMGELGYIRNDLIHKKGIASKEETGRCKVLKWFKPGERIILGMHHVLDFLNQLGLMTTTPDHYHEGISTFWSLVSEKEKALLNKPTPELISLRTWTEEGLENSPQHVVAIVFENGVFLNIPIDHVPDSLSLQERIEFVNKTRIDESGNILFADGRVIDRESLYRKAVDTLLGKEPRANRLNVLGLEFRIRR